jgi:hypothetical protein
MRVREWTGCDYYVPMRRTPRVDYRHGDHVCTFYSSREEQIGAAVDFIRDGLASGNRCLYVCCDQTPEEFGEELRRAGIDTEAERARGALTLVTKSDAHLQDGVFDAARMIELIAAELDVALKNGFEGLRGAGDMTWLLDEAPGAAELLGYEALLNYFFSNKRAAALCQYDRNRLPAKVLETCLATHPHVRVEGPKILANPYYEEPTDAMTRSRDGFGIRGKIATIDALSVTS